MPREALPPPVADDPAEAPRAPERIVISAKAPGVAQPRQNVRTDTPVDSPAGEASERVPAARRGFNPRLLGIGAVVVLGIVLLLVLLRGSPDDGAEGPAEPTVVDAPDKAPRPIPRPAGAEPRPASPARAEGEDTGFFTADANIPAQVYVDGTPKGRTPLKRVVVPAGPRVIMLEAVDTGEQKSFGMEFEAGKERKVMEFFEVTPSPKRKR
jgi:hypothetical protein